MVLFHLLRCQRYLLRGLRDRARVSKMIYGAAPLPLDSPTAVVPGQSVRTVAAKVAQKASTTTDGAACGTWVRGVIWPWYRKLPHDPAFGHFLAQPITMPVYCGLRMVDELGHVNNAKYLEISEFARWHQLSFLGIGHVMEARKIAFVVSDLSITYQREIAPCKTVWVRTRFILPAEIAPAASAAHASTSPAVADKKRFFIEHELWSADGQKLHAALTLAAALIGPVGYEQELVQRYGTAEEKMAYAAAHAKPARPRATLNCEHVLADVAGLATTAEVRQLFAHVDHVCTPVEEVMDGSAAAAAAAAAAPGGAQAKNAEDKERADRISMLAYVWKTSRNTLRRKSLMPKVRKDKKD